MNYKVDDSDFPSDSSHEKRGHWVGVAEHVGHAMTFKILTDDTQHIIYHSNIWSTLDPKHQNLHLDPLNADEVFKPIIHSHLPSSTTPDHGEISPPMMTTDQDHGEIPSSTMMIDPMDLVDIPSFCLNVKMDNVFEHASLSVLSNMKRSLARMKNIRCSAVL
jgi:hypothetical protein